MATKPTLVLIPCSARKASQTPLSSDISGHSILKQLPPPIAERLAEDRMELMTRIGQGEFPGTYVDSNAAAIPAFLSYTGALFREVSSAWNTIYKNSMLNVLIVSALYGLLDSREEILPYNAKMNQTKQFWKQKNLFEILSAYVTQNKIARIFNLLPKPYLGSLQGSLKNVETVNVCIWEKEDRLLGSASLGKKGKWIRDFVLYSRFPEDIDGFRVTYQTTSPNLKECCYLLIEMQ